MFERNKLEAFFKHKTQKDERESGFGLLKDLQEAIIFQKHAR